MRKIEPRPLEEVPRKYITIGSAVVRFAIGKTTLHALIAANLIRTRKLGARTLIDVEAADRYFESLPSASQVGSRRKSSRS